ncbi:response regulator, partial [Ideonella livida]
LALAGCRGLDANALTRRQLLQAVQGLWLEGAAPPPAPVAAPPAQEAQEAEEAEEAAEAAEAATPAAPLAEGAVAPLAPPASRPRVLVAEDNEANQKVIRFQLGKLGYPAEVASDGEQALALWRQGGFDLLLTDLHMPRLDGYQLTAALRALPGGQDLPIIALTANALGGEAERCLAAGMSDYLSKPTRLPVLQAMLEKWLDAKASSPPAAPAPGQRDD